MAPMMKHGGPAPEQQFGDEPRVHPHERGIVAQIVEMRHASLGAGKITNRRVEVVRRHAVPAEPHGSFRIEVVTTASAARSQHGEQRRARLYAKTKQRVGYSRTQQLEVHKSNAEFPAVQSLGGNVRGKNRPTQYQGSWAAQ